MSKWVVWGQNCTFLILNNTKCNFDPHLWSQEVAYWKASSSTLTVVILWSFVICNSVYLFRLQLHAVKHALYTLTVGVMQTPSFPLYVTIMPSVSRRTARSVLFVMKMHDLLANNLIELFKWVTPRVGPGTPSSFPFVHLLHLFPFLLFPFFHWLYLFSFLSIPSLSTRIVPLRFQAGGRRRQPNLGLGLVCCL